MLLIAVRDALWRWRRFLVALVATALVLSLTLVLDGVNRSFPNEAHRTVAAFDAGAWLVPDGTTSVFFSSTVLPADTAAAAADLPGAEEASAVAVVSASLPDDTNVNLIGVVPGLFTDPPVIDGRAPTASGEATAERSIGIGIGERAVANGRPFTIVGLTSGLSYAAGIPVLYVPLVDAQAIGYGGQPLATTVVTKGTPTENLDGFLAVDNAFVEDDLLAPLVNARKTIGLVLGLLWIVAAMVIGSVVYLTSIDRSRDFAVLKATGATNQSLLAGLAFQASLLSGGASALAVVMSFGLAGAFPMRTEVASGSYLTLVAVAIGVALVAAGVSARRTLQIDPALAFAGA
ncbi:MAG: ABC transporter permease [Acidimicrobiales bacterium]